MHACIAARPREPYRAAPRMHHGGGGKGAGVYHAPVNHASYTRGIRPADGGPGAGATAVETGSASVLHENNYDPSTGSPARSFVRKGYFNDPDWTGPRREEFYFAFGTVIRLAISHLARPFPSPSPLPPPPDFDG